MNEQPTHLGGRLPLLDPHTLQGPQAKLYGQINSTMIPWAENSGFTGKTADGRFVGPFNPFLFSPLVSEGFLAFQSGEEKHTSLNNRVRQVIILTVGGIWQSKYELYAHIAVARKAGLSESAIQALAHDRSPEDLQEDELVAHTFARQLVFGYSVDDRTYEEAHRIFGNEGVVNMIYLIGIYLFTCALLNGFAIPAPTSSVSAET